jgi:hypothetical protein
MRGQGAVVIALRLGLASKYLEKEHRTELSITPSSEDGIGSSAQSKSRRLSSNVTKFIFFAKENIIKRLATLSIMQKLNNSIHYQCVRRGLTNTTPCGTTLLNPWGNIDSGIDLENLRVKILLILFS